MGTPDFGLRPAGRQRLINAARKGIHATKWPPEPGSRKQVFVCGVAERSGPVRQDRIRKYALPPQLANTLHIENRERAFVDVCYVQLAGVRVHR